MNKQPYDGDREQLISRYIEAVDTGDEDAQADLLETATAFIAKGDVLLESTLWEIHLTVAAELMPRDAVVAAEPLVTAKAAAERVASAANSSFSTPVAATYAQVEAMLASQQNADDRAEDAEPVPLTLRDVAATLRSQINRSPARFVPVVRELIARLEARPADEPLQAEYLTRRGARSLLTRLSLPAAHAGVWLEKYFHEALFSLEAARRQDIQLAAARRQQRRNQQTPSGLASQPLKSPIENESSDNAR